jgi:hypothetical protein
MKRSLVRVATPESAQKILFRLLKDGKITVEDIDKESPSSALLRETAAKYYPEIKLKPYVNLLRHDVIVQSNGIQKAKGIKKVAARSKPDF